jgi:hypothetical protein
VDGKRYTRHGNTQIGFSVRKQRLHQRPIVHFV